MWVHEDQMLELFEVLSMLKHLDNRMPSWLLGGFPNPTKALFGEGVFGISERTWVVHGAVVANTTKK